MYVNCRDLVSDTLVSGDAEKMIKLSLILAHPVTSQNLRDDAGTALLSIFRSFLNIINP